MEASLLVVKYILFVFNDNWNYYVLFYLLLHLIIILFYILGFIQ